MILYKKAMANKAKERPSQNVHVTIDELPERETYTFRTPKERVKFKEWQKYQINKKIDKITLLLLLIFA